MRGDPSAPLDYLLPYFRGIYFATVALEGRLVKLGPEGREAVSEVSRYQTMVKRYRDALVETEQMRREQR